MRRERAPRTARSGARRSAAARRVARTRIGIPFCIRVCACVPIRIRCIVSRVEGPAEARGDAQRAAESGRHAEPAEARGDAAKAGGDTQAAAGRSPTGCPVGSAAGARAALSNHRHDRDRARCAEHDARHERGFSHPATHPPRLPFSRPQHNRLRHRLDGASPASSGSVEPLPRDSAALVLCHWHNESRRAHCPHAGFRMA